jgi:hypothetical protein
MTTFEGGVPTTNNDHNPNNNRHDIDVSAETA